jgi:hypothetical protein
MIIFPMIMRLVSLGGINSMITSEMSQGGRDDHGDLAGLTTRFP